MATIRMMARFEVPTCRDRKGKLAIVGKDGFIDAHRGMLRYVLRDGTFGFFRSSDPPAAMAALLNISAATLVEGMEPWGPDRDAGDAAEPTRLMLKPSIFGARFGRK